MGEKLRIFVERNLKLVNLIVLLVGILLMVIGLLLGKASPSVALVMVGVGSSVVASALVFYLSSFMLVRQLEVQDIVSEWGLVAVYRTRAEMNQKSNQYLGKAKGKLDIIAFGLRSLRDNMSSVIEERVKSGLSIRILTIDPNSTVVSLREIDEQQSDGSIKKTICDLASWVSQIRAHQASGSQVEIRFYNALPQDFYYRVDDHLFVGPYLFGKTSQQTISYEFRSGSLGFDYWTEYFDSLWSNRNFSVIHEEFGKSA